MPLLFQRHTCYDVICNARVVDLYRPIWCCLLICHCCIVVFLSKILRSSLLFSLLFYVPFSLCFLSPSPKGDLRLRSRNPAQEAGGWQSPRQGDAEGESKERKKGGVEGEGDGFSGSCLAATAVCLLLNTMPQIQRARSLRL